MTDTKVGETATDEDLLALLWPLTAKEHSALLCAYE